MQDNKETEHANNDHHHNVEDVPASPADKELSDESLDTVSGGAKTPSRQAAYK